MKLMAIKSIVAVTTVAVGLSAWAVPEGAVQLWEGGPYWASSNLGESEVQDHPEYGAFYKFDDAEAAVKLLLGQEWRVPSKGDFDKLVDDSYCTKVWDETKKGWTFTGKGAYSSNSIFLPAAGYDGRNGQGRIRAGLNSCYWSSKVYEGTFMWSLKIDTDTAFTSKYERSAGASVRPVR